MSENHLDPRTLVLRTLAGAPPEQLPIGELVIDDALVKEVVGLSDEATLPLSAKKALLHRWGHSLVTVAFSHGWGAPLQPDTKERLERVNYWAIESDLFVFVLVDGPFSLAARIWSWEQALMRFARGDDDLSGFLADALIEMSDWFAKLVDAGAQGIVIGDDIAYRRGPYVNPQHLRLTYFPFLTLMIATAQDMGLAVVFHSDGNLWPVWEDLIHAGVDAIHGLDPYSAMSLPLARERSPHTLCLWGNFDVGWLAALPNEENIAAHLQTLLEPLRGTPMIFGSSSGLHAGLPLQVLDHLYRQVKNWRWRGLAK